MKAISKSLMFLFFVFVLQITSTSAQSPECGIVDFIDYPIDITVFEIVQGYGAPSPRHQGRFHTGEDWFGGALPGYGLASQVRAIAAGRVTYASPTGWGRDGGVVIIEHTFPDGSVAYSQYGHMTEIENARFPARYSCVRAGDIVGAVGDARPAPHLHFEIRVNNPDIPGPGYEWEDPTSLGYREPRQFITNWQAWLSEASLWHVQLASLNSPVTPPLLLDDNSLLYISPDASTENGFLRRVLPDGRVLWRVALRNPTVAVIGFQGNPLLISASGTIGQLNFDDGSIGESWELGFAVDSPPIEAADESLIFHTPDNALVAVAPNLRDVLWRTEDVEFFAEGFAASNVIGLVTADQQLLSLTRAGEPVDRAQLRGSVGFASSLTGDLLVYTRGGLWQIDAEGEWALYAENAPVGEGARALTMGADGSLYLFDGASLYHYGENNNVVWQSAVEGVQGDAILAYIEGKLLILSKMGDVIAFGGESGLRCNRLHVWGNESAHVWYDLGADGVLRIALGDLLFGLDWADFTRNCV